MGSVFDDYVRYPEQKRVWIRVDSKDVTIEGPIEFDAEDPDYFNEWKTWR